MGLITLHVFMIDGKIRIQALQGIFSLPLALPSYPLLSIKLPIVCTQLL